IKGLDAPVLTPQIQHTPPSTPSFTPMPSGETFINTRLINRPNPMTPLPTTHPPVPQSAINAGAVTEQDPPIPALPTARKPFLSRRSLIIAGASTLGVAGALGGTWFWLRSKPDNSTSTTAIGNTNLSSKGTMFGVDPQHSRVVPNEQTLTATTA